jgi:hypothetical protein
LANISERPQHRTAIESRVSRAFQPFLAEHYPGLNSGFIDCAKSLLRLWRARPKCYRIPRILCDSIPTSR